MRRANNTGTIYKLSGKRRRPWIARVFKGYDEEGNRIYQTVGYYSRKAEAERALALNDLQPLSSRANITLAELFEEWKMQYYPKLSSSMQSGYTAAFHYLRPVSHMKFIDLRTAHIQRTLDGVASVKSQSTTQKVRVLFGLLYKYALENDIVAKNYAQFVHMPKFETIEKEVIPDTEIAVYKKHDDDPAAQIMLMLIYSGLRIQELLNLTVFDVDLEQRVLKGGLKTDSGKNRIVPLSAKTYDYWVQWCAGRDGYLFVHNGRRISQEYFRTHMLYPLQDKLSLPRRTPHKARHTCATLLAREGVAPLLIQQILGHSDYAFTANVYTHKDYASLMSAINSI